MGNSIKLFYLSLLGHIHVTKTGSYHDDGVQILQQEITTVFNWSVGAEGFSSFQTNLLIQTLWRTVCCIQSYLKLGDTAVLNAGIGSFGSVGRCWKRKSASP